MRFEGGHQPTFGRQSSLFAALLEALFWGPPRVAKLIEDLEDHRGRERASRLDELGQLLSFEELHCQPRHVPMHPRAKDPDDVLALDPGTDLGLQLEALSLRRLRHDLGLHHLERAPGAGRELLARVDHAHPTCLAEEPLHAEVAAEHGAQRKIGLARHGAQQCAAVRGEIPLIHAREHAPRTPLTRSSRAVSFGRACE